MPAAILASLATKPVILDKGLGTEEITSTLLRGQYNIENSKKLLKKCSL